MQSKIKLLARKLKIGEDNTRGSSRSTPKGRIIGTCPECHGKLITQQVDRFNIESLCDQCGLVEDFGNQTLTQKGL